MRPGNIALVAYWVADQSERMRRNQAAVKALMIQAYLPDLGSQFEDLMIEVWRQEEFERKHPFTCAVMREPSLARGFSQPSKTDRRRRKRLSSV